MNKQIDSSIPVLTEVISIQEIAQATKINQNIEQTTRIVPQLPPLSDTTIESINQNQPIKIHQVNMVQNEATSMPFQINEDDWKKLEATLKENILRQVLSRIDFVLEHKIRDSLAEILQVSVDRLTSDIQVGLKNSIEDVVTRAVTQEIAKAKMVK